MQLSDLDITKAWATIADSKKRPKGWFKDQVSMIKDAQYSAIGLKLFLLIGLTTHHVRRLHVFIADHHPEDDRRLDLGW